MIEMTVMSPLTILICGAVLTGVLGSMCVLIAISVNTWEYFSYDTQILSLYSQINASSEYFYTAATADRGFGTLTQVYATDSANDTQTQRTFYLYSQYSSVWRLCDNLSGFSRSLLQTVTGKTVNKCFTFITEYDDDASLPMWMKSIGSMHNSLASCFIVCVIDLFAAIVLGTFAIMKKQVPACMITGVLYSMSGLFATFGLIVFHTKMYYENFQCYAFMEEKLPPPICKARVITTGWAVVVAWMSVIICSLACGAWLFVTRAFRIIKSKTMM